MHNVLTPLLLTTLHDYGPLTACLQPQLSAGFTRMSSGSPWICLPRSPACCPGYPPSPFLPTALRFLRFAWEPFNTIIAFWLALAFHAVYAYRTQDSWVPDPRLIIWTRNAEATKHAAG